MVQFDLIIRFVNLTAQYIFKMPSNTGQHLSQKSKINLKGYHCMVMCNYDGFNAVCFKMSSFAMLGLLHKSNKPKF